MQNYLGFFTPTADQAVGIAALLVVCAGFSAIGAVLLGSRRMPESDLVIGWAAGCFTFTLLGAALRIELSAIAPALAVGAALCAICLAARRRLPVSSDLLRATVLASPAIWLAGCMAISQWDEFTQWIPNARYIYLHDVFPGSGMPETFSNFPAYPHGLAYVIYLTSQIAGHLVENASAMFSVVLTAAFGVSIGRTIRAATTRRDPAARVPMGLSALPPQQIGWTYCALGGLAATALNPTFVPKIAFTGYADAPTSALVGMLCIQFWMLLNTLAGEETEFRPRYLAACIGITGVALISVKQVNLVLFILIAGGAFLAAIRDPKIRTGDLLRLSPIVVAPPAAIYLLWRLHVGLHDVTGEAGFYPLSEWHLAHIWTIAERMLLIASKKGGYFLVMLVATGFAVRALWRTRTPLDRMSLIIGTVFVGYTAFLWFTYVAHFTEGEALRAASYWRYNIHLGGACAVFGGYGLALCWRRWIAQRLRRPIGWIAIVAAVAVPFAIASKIRFDARPQKLYVRDVAENIATDVSQGTRIAILDLTGDGAYGMIMRYVVSLQATVVGEMTAGNDPTAPNISKFLEASQPDVVWIHVPTAAAQEALGVRLPDRASSLLRKRSGGWSIVRSWPYPGYEDPNALPD